MTGNQNNDRQPERDRVEPKSEHAPHWWRAALDVSSDAAFLVDHASLKVVDANRSACDKLGYSWDHLRTSGLTRVFPYLKMEELRHRAIREQGEIPLMLPTVMCHQDGTELLVELSVRPVDSSPTAPLVCLARTHGDLADALPRGVFHDSLTGLPDRRIFEQRLRQACARTERGPSDRFAVLFIDVDQFKGINDTLGHVGGDNLLRAFAERLSRCVRSLDMVARFGGDEFLVFLDEVQSNSDVLSVVERIQRELDVPFPYRDKIIMVRVSIGVAIGRPANHQPDELLEAADRAMYRVKAAGGDGHAMDESDRNVDGWRQSE